MVVRRFLFLLVALLLLGCGPAPWLESQPQAQPAARPAHPSYAMIAGARTFAGRTVGAAPAERPVTIAVVFASWCGHCHAELAILRDLAATEPRLRVVGLNAFEEYQERSSRERLRAFLADDVPWLEAIVADDALLAALGSPSSIPAVFVYDGGGRLTAAFGTEARPVAERDELLAAIRAAGG